jgi:hypothetical protein
MERFDAEGINFSAPTRTVFVKQEAEHEAPRK